MLKKTAGFAEFSLQIRPIGGVFRTLYTFGVSSGGSSVYRLFSPYFIVPSNHDVRMICSADTGSTDVSASISGILVKVIS